MKLYSSKYSFVLLFVINLVVQAQYQTIRFEHITIDDGLSSNHISNIIQDDEGYLWIGTQDGLNRYDGDNFKQFRHIPGNINSLSDYAVSRIFEDSKGLFWISTREGLDLYDPQGEIFTHFKPIKDDLNSISSGSVHVVEEDKSGNIWVGTRDGLNLYNQTKKNFKIYRNDPLNKNSLSHNNVISMLADSKGNFWVGTQNGLDRYDYETDSFEIFFSNPNNPKSLSGNRIAFIFEDSNGVIWVGTTEGLSRMVVVNGDSLEFIIYRHDPNSNNSLGSNRVRNMAEDSRGNLWIGTHDAGVTVYNPDLNHFYNYQYSPDDPSSISENFIMTVFVDDFDNVWIGTPSYGINKYSPAQKSFSLFQPEPFAKKEAYANDISAILIDNNKNIWLGTYGNGIKVYQLKSIPEQNKILFEFRSNSFSTNKLSSDDVLSIIQDRDGIIWIGTFGGGLNRYDPVTNRMEVFQNNPNNSASLGNDFIHKVFEDSEGTIWVCTGGSGLNKFNKNAKTFKRYSHNPKSPDDPRYFNSNEATSILEDKNGLIWVSTTTAGISRFDKKKETFVHYKHNQEDVRSISSDRVNTIFQDKKGRLWVGTYSGGLNLYNEKANSFKHYLMEDGLPSNTIYSITEDNEGNLWLGTTNGISKFDPEENLFRNYDKSDGLQGKTFYPNAVLKNSETGIIYFGGSNGLNYFVPSAVELNRIAPKIVITDFKVFDKPLRIHSKNNSTDRDVKQNEIVLSYDQNIITIEFAAMDFTSPRKNQYAYMLVGFDDNWVFCGNKTEVTYTNLDPGNYEFKVKGTNSDGVWNEAGTSVAVIIDPPFWKTWWAYLIYLTLASTGFFFVRKYELNRIKLRNDLKNKEFESKKFQEVDQIKSRFFANISHEFRTPLTIILGSLEKIKAKMENTSDDKEFIVMERNASRLLQLINQLLELSRIESGNVKLQVSENDIVKFLRRIISSFSSLTYQKRLEVTFNGIPIVESNPSEEILVYFEKKKLETVFYNLLSNAFKFTPEGEKIAASVSEESGNVKISFENTGVEISSENIEKIFDRFYQVDDSGTRSYEGTGIGLSLVKEYVELHKGKIEVQSGNQKTTFIIYLPLGKSHLKDDEIIKEELVDDNLTQALELDKAVLIPSEISGTTVSDSDKTIILVVEDNPDLREMIKEKLQDAYSILEAENGIKGFKLAEENIPDLIISDIMMPEMDGYEFTKKVKTNEKTDHIPVILLTAKAATEDKLEGLELGADDYLIKPFHEKELVIRVRNLIKIRQQMREKYLAQSLLKPGSVVVPSSQKVFIEKLTSIIDKNISNENFSVEVLCKEIGMSRTQLHRKIKFVTNQSTTEFIRNYRLQLAAELLMQEAGNVAEISNQVGFGSQAYFTKLFQELYGVTPLEYRKQYKK